MEYDYTLIRSTRKTLALEIGRDLTITVRAPNRCPRTTIDKFVAEHSEWIESHLEKARLRNEARPEPTAAEARRLTELAHRILPGRVAYFSRIMGVKPTRITITGARTRFGSCSGKNSVSFSWRLMAYPTEEIDYVVVHELAHITHHNHSAAFYSLVESVMPDYKKRVAILKHE